jgi:hypothetical protein
MATAIGVHFLSTLLKSLDERLGTLLEEDIFDVDYISFRVAEFFDPSASRLRSQTEFSGVVPEVLNYCLDFIEKFQLDLSSYLVDKEMSPELETQAKVPKRKKRKITQCDGFKEIFASANGNYNSDSTEDSSLEGALKSEFEGYLKKATGIKGHETCLQWFVFFNFCWIIFSHLFYQVEKKFFVVSHHVSVSEDHPWTAYWDT